MSKHLRASTTTGPDSALSPPPNWPPHLRYLTANIYSPHLSPHHLAHLRSSPSRLDLPPVPIPKRQTRIRPITDPSHPAVGQYGLFAAKPIPPDTCIVHYLGLVHCDVKHGDDHAQTAQSSASAGSGSDSCASQYDLMLDRERGIAVDAQQAGNEARFINDYRGVPLARSERDRNRASSQSCGRRSSQSAAPNAEFRDVWASIAGGLAERRVAVFSLKVGKRGGGGSARGIAAGTEILVSYGKGFWKGQHGQGGDAQDEEVDLAHTS